MTSAGSAKLRLDQALVARRLCPSREKAVRLVLAGQVRVNGRPARKPSESVTESDRLEIPAPEKYVSRGGYKLEHALDFFRLPVQGWVAVDLGASTGGFTDCLLQRGAARVAAVDVGRGQLAWKLRQDPRVVVREKTNARHLAPADLGADFPPADLVVIDCSFISLRLILPAAWRLLRHRGHAVALVKPQFEAGKAEADKGGGVIRSPAVRQRVLDELRKFLDDEARWQWKGVTESPLAGPAGNREFLVWLEKND